MSDIEKQSGVQFTKDGPSIPFELLQALEDGDLVIFCGAGVSRCCGLPDFSGLVTELCDLLGRPMEPDEQELFEKGAYDVALGLIETRIGKNRLRPAIRRVLNIQTGADLATHEALLQLATTKQGRLRLVTTNFDQAFALARQGNSPPVDYAPHLPVPATSWSSVVHLHGGLGNPKDPEGHSLIVTSADFGRAYLTEGWAGRFLGELFRRTAAILFVGYSVSDPAIRYLVDAFAADRAAEGAHTAKAYILSGSSAENTAQDQRTWRNRGIETLLYSPENGHNALHETLRNCAKRYKTGRFDRTAIIMEYGSQTPLGALDKEAISQITWALKDANGHTARQFATLKPEPPIDWLEILAAENLLTLSTPLHSSIAAVTCHPISRAAPSLHPVTHGLADWLVTKLATPELVSWVIKQGSHLHHEFAEEVRRRLATQTLPRLPHGAERLWAFLAAPAAPIYTQLASHDVLHYYATIGTQPWDPLFRDLVRSWFAPTIQLKEPYRWTETDTFDTEAVGSYARIELAPAIDDSSWDTAEKLLGRLDASMIAPDLLEDTTALLHRGLTYLEFLEEISSEDDGTFSARASIDDHGQNNRFRDWTVYIHLLRESWERVAQADPTRAREEVSRWMRIPYPLFRRFVLWTTGKPGGLLASELVGYLTSQPPSALWGRDTRRELFQCLRRNALQFLPEDADRLCSLILAGPARAQFATNLSPQEFAEIADRAIHLRLLNLREGGLTLPALALDRLASIAQKHPQWPEATTERDDFVMWSGGAHWVGANQREPQQNDYLEWTDDQIGEDLRAMPTSPAMLQRWRGLLHATPERALLHLELLGQANLFEADLWGTALEHLRDEPLQADCIRVYASFGARLGPAFVAQHLHQLTSLLERYSRGKQHTQDDALWILWDLLLPAAEELPLAEGNDPVITALNSPIGNLTEVVLITLGDYTDSAYKDLPHPVRARLERLLNGSLPAHRHARVILARATAWLYRLNPALIVPSFVARFDWDSSDEARQLWLGYLMAPRITPELWEHLRPVFLKVFGHSPALGDAEDQLYGFFALLLLNADIVLDPIQARQALKRGTANGRSHVAWYWWRQADGPGDHGATLFRERLHYLLTDVWPLELELREGASENLARLASCCGTEFANAVTTIQPLLTRTNDPHTFLSFLWSFKETNHADTAPKATLTLLDALLGDDIRWSWPDLEHILARMVATPEIRTDPRFVRLNDLVQRFL